MLDKYRRGIISREKLMDKLRDYMSSVTEYRLSGTVDESYYNNIMDILDEIEINHSIEQACEDECVCYEADKVIKCIDLIDVMGDAKPREIAIPADKFANYIVSHCRLVISEFLSEYSLGFNREDSNDVNELRETIQEESLNYAVANINENLDKLSIIVRDKKTGQLRILKPRDEEVGKVIVKKIIDNYDMFYIKKVYLEKKGIVEPMDSNIRNSLLKIKFYNNSLYILRVLLELNIKKMGHNAVNIGVANCFRSMSVKVRGDLDEVIISLDKFANRKGNLEFDYINKVAKDIDSFHKDILANKIDYNLVKETIALLTANVDLNLIREIIAKIGVVLLTEHKSGKIADLEKLCILDGIINKAF